MPIPVRFARSCPALVALVLCHALPAAAGELPSVRRAVDAAIVPLMAQYQVPGMAVAVTVDGQTRFFNYGVASKDKRTPVTEHTVFEVGSVSKPFTAILALYAQASGKLSMSDHPGAYLPQLAGTPIDGASLLHLGTYTAGELPLQVPDEVADAQGLMRYYRNWKSAAAPGTVRSYSNLSIGLLGQVTARALASDFGVALEGLFGVLGLQDSYVRVPPAAMARYAWGYAQVPGAAGDQPVRVRPDLLDAEAYGVKSSAADMIRFVQLNIDPAHLRAPARRAIQATQLGYFQVGAMVQGLGWEQYRAPVTVQQLLAGNSPAMINQPQAAVPAAPQAAPPGTWFNKTGSTRGFGTYVAFVPSQRIGVVLLANKSYPIAARVAAAHAILTQLAPVPDAGQEPQGRRPGRLPVSQSQANQMRPSSPETAMLPDRTR